MTGYTASVAVAPLMALQYERDRLDRITRKTETIGGVTDAYDYEYDVASRLRQVHKNGAIVATYIYDAKRSSGPSTPLPPILIPAIPDHLEQVA